jgi:hypothetical protein
MCHTSRHPSENISPVRTSASDVGAKPGDDERSASFGSREFTIETCERLGTGWSQWQINGPELLERNWPTIWDDAVRKRYAWKADIKRPAIRKPR